MFQTDTIAKKIRNARIRLNMTQNELADQMNVSYQAVSNWERGNSLPDISRLSELCSLLHLSLNELLGEDVMLAEKIIQGEPVKNIQIKNLTHIAPLLEPQLLKELIRSADKSGYQLSDVAALAPFLESELTEELILDHIAHDFDEILSLAPFLSADTVNHLVNHVDISNAFIDVGMLCSLCPYLNEQSIEYLAHFVIPENLTVLISIAPFTNKNTLKELIERTEIQDLDDLIEGLMNLKPFIDEEIISNILYRYKNN